MGTCRDDMTRERTGLAHTSALPSLVASHLIRGLGFRVESVFCLCLCAFVCLPVGCWLVLGLQVWGTRPPCRTSSRRI
jgi:hypothetical protein